MHTGSVPGGKESQAVGLTCRLRSTSGCASENRGVITAPALLDRWEDAKTGCTEPGASWSRRLRVAALITYDNRGTLKGWDGWGETRAPGGLRMLRGVAKADYPSVLSSFELPWWLSKESANLPTMRETQVRSLGREDPLEKEMTIHFGILAW